MARLSEYTWGVIKADFEVKSISNRALAEQYGITETAIRKRASRDGWIRGGSSRLIEKKINVINEVYEISSQSSRLSSQHIAAIDEEVLFRLQNDKDLQFIQDKINVLAKQIDNPSHALALMTATVKHREARLGKSPDTAIQINNSMPVQSGPTATLEEIKEVLANNAKV